MTKSNKLDWLDEFEHLANDILSESPTCDHAVIERAVKTWYETILNEDYLMPAKQATTAAVASLATEVLTDMPQCVYNKLQDDSSTPELVTWVQEILMLGRCLEHALHTKQLNLDDD